MALTKIINDGDELIFDLKNMAPGARPDISVILVKRSRPANVLVIRADKSIIIKHIKKDMVVASERTTIDRDNGTVISQGVYEFSEA
jgi:hypothetical protein